MKTFTKLSLILCGLILAAQMSLGQTILPMTTLSAAITTSSTTQISLTSATGVVATSTVLYIADGGTGEAVFVNSLSGTTAYVTRGYQSLGKARAHASGTLVFVVQGNAVLSVNNVQPTGSCTRANEQYLPVISMGLYGTSSTISDCVGGVWVAGTPVTKLMNYELEWPGSGGTAYTSSGTSTAKATNTMYCTEIDLPYNKYLTGLGMLNGASTGTDKWMLALYDSAGNAFAHSAVAGATASGNSTFQKQAFTTPYYAVGPAQYFACAQGDSGTSATINLLVTGTNDIYLTQKYATQTFGTLAAITVPTAFTTAAGGYWILY